MVVENRNRGLLWVAFDYVWVFDLVRKLVAVALQAVDFYAIVSLVAMGGRKKNLEF